MTDVGVRRPLAGRRIVTTREEVGRLDSLLATAGADVVHVPLIEILDAADGGVALAEALEGLADVDWLIVTSRHGARRVGAAVAEHANLRLGVVGTRTAAELAQLAGRAVDVLPVRQTAADLAAALPSPSHNGERVVVAQADRADGALVVALADRGYDVVAVTAYTTSLRYPSDAERRAALEADAVAFASGSAAEAWAGAIGVETPPVAVAIGPVTQRAAAAVGLKVTHVAADHSVEGLAAEVTAALLHEP